GPRRSNGCASSIESERAMRSCTSARRPIRRRSRCSRSSSNGASGCRAALTEAPAMWCRCSSAAVEDAETAWKAGRREAWRAGMSKVGRSVLRVQQSTAPLAVLECEAGSIVEAGGVSRPELDCLRHDAVSGPVRRPRDGAAFEARAGLLELTFERGARVELRALLRCPRAELRLARPGGEIGVRVGIRDPLDVALDAHLYGGAPGKTGRRRGMW